METYQSITEFFADDTEAGSILFFYSTYDEVSIEVEEEEMVEVALTPEELEQANQSKNAEEENTPVPTTKLASRILKKIIMDPQLQCNARLNELPSGNGEMCFVYFIRLQNGPFPIFSGNSSISNALSEYLEIGCSTGDLLANLETVLQQVLIPIIDPENMVLDDVQSSIDPAEENNNDPQNDVNYTETTTVNASKVMDTMKSEFRSNLQKFSSQVSHAIQQVKGDIHLTIPNVVIDQPQSVVNDYELVNQLELALEDWLKTVSTIINQENQKRLRGSGPLAEIEYWRERNANFSMIYEQIQMPNVQKMIKVLELVEADMISNFKYQFSELSKLYIEAKDNVKFLTTLERHFKNIVNGSFTTIADTLPSMMNAIRMVWIISRHYNTDERMVPLMELIASDIASKVQREISIRSILQKSPDKALKQTGEAKMVLELWHSTYMKVRERIEASGTDHRWEFDRKRLFEQTNYMAKICENCQEFATVLDQFHKFLGPELKAVTGDQQGIDQMLGRVQSLVDPLESVPFDIFDRRYKSSWESVMLQFREQVLEIESMTRQFIDSSFQKLRSAEGAFDLLQNFQHIQSRESINKQMMEKYQDILLQYSKEVEHLAELFETHRHDPPIYRNYPPIAGAISWAQGLYHRAKKPILRFRSMQDLLKSQLGEEVKEKYLQFARLVDAYIKDLHHQWQENVPAIINDRLKQSLLGPRMIETGKTENTNMPILMMPEAPYHVNFAPDLQSLIREAKYLDRLGFEIPKEALNVTLQEEKYVQYIQDLNHMLAQYDVLLQSLSTVETHLLQKQLKDVKNILKAGFTPLNWNSQRIPSFIESCTKALSEFQNKLNQIHKSSSMIEQVVDTIASTVLIRESDFPSEDGEDTATLDIATFYERLEQIRQTRLDHLVEKYHSIGPLLIKVEEIVAGVNTGRSPELSTYYLFWERRIFNAITQMILASMATFQSLLNVATSETPGMSLLKRRRPLCKVLATMNGKDIVLTPSLPDVYKYLSKAIKHSVEGSKRFLRWMHGTCILTEPQLGAEDEEPIVFTFYEDISSSPHIIKMMLNLNEAIHKVFKLISRYMDGWKRYDQIYGLWNTKRQAALEKLVDRNPSCVYFDARIASYVRLIENIQSQVGLKDIEFIQIDCLPVTYGISKQAEEWKISYGRILRILCQRKFMTLDTKMTTYEQALEKEPENLESLKSILHTIAQIAQENMDMELKYTDVMEGYSTLQSYNIPFDDSTNSDSTNANAATDNSSTGTVTEGGVSPAKNTEYQQAMTLDARWKALINSSKTKNLRLTKVKEKFRCVTQQDAISFDESSKGLLKQFELEGPGSYGVELIKGVELMASFQKQLQTYQERRQELVNAEQLFNLGISSYPELHTIDSELQELNKIYDIYANYQDFLQSMTQMLWTELDLNQLISGIQDLLKQLRKLPKKLKDYATFRELEKLIMQLEESVPLISQLKNDSIQLRHWEAILQTLDDQTKAKEWNYKTFTLTQFFQLELSQNRELVEEISNAAVQENKIEVELVQIEKHWENVSFELAKYIKNEQERGMVLRAADDIRLQLEDHLLNIQTITGSRFIAAFADRARKWEKQLNIVNDCMECWFVVQRKWMYLESIFVGAADIRLQLPEEAKNFDAIDKVWRTIMASTNSNPNVIDACTQDNRIDTLNNLSDRLDKCQKSLSDYLDTKRASFPRFFFISDDELLSVLGSSDPTSIQVHLLKLFDNVKYFHFSKNEKQVLGMESSETESFSFIPSQAPVIEGPVESWMTTVEDEMRATLKHIAKEGVFEYASMPRAEWLVHVLGMVGLAGSQIWWTWEVEDVFRRVNEGGEKYAMKAFESKLTGQLNDLVARVRQPLDSLSRKKINTLLIIDVHARDIVDSFVRDSILHAKEFAWESQLRFYWDKSMDDIVIQQCTGAFSYGYEYMGLNGRLVITPLTDRCYMTLTQALTFKLGGSPAGPAGTGKTETVKDLAKSLALPCYVINCGEGLDYKAMGSIFSGLTQVGAWGCFDEFNRINIEVLSVVSAQLRAIQNALNTNEPTVDIGFGTDIAIRRKNGFATCGFFITMNPGYAGRTELPDNLKALFRPVTMIVPDLLQICQIILFSEGFEHAVVLSKKMTVLYKLSKEQLSKQYHYDFGLRALKSVLVMAGSMKREYSGMSEELVLMRALRDSNMPKFVFEDVPLFRGLINDLFPGLECPRVGYVSLKQAIEADLTKHEFNTSNPEVFSDQVDKIVQMYETMLVRHTTMIVGPTGGGKSLVLSTLARASGPALDLNVKMSVLNPKAQSVAELYGTMDPITRDWTDGVLSKLFRELNQPLSQGREKERRWIVYDGDVDAVWVENMNSVMDDNRLLTLPNGERIRLQDHCSMICETFDLQFASPATISRCGMVWVDPKNVGYRPFYERWLKRRCVPTSTRQDEATLLLECFDKYVPKCVDFILEGLVSGEVTTNRCTQVIPISNIELVKQLANTLDAFIPEDVALTIDRNDTEGMFIFALIWSLGAALVDASRPKFDEFLKSISECAMPHGMMYDYFYDLESHRWVDWGSQVTDYVEPSPFNFSSILVPTTDSVLYTFLLSKTLPTTRPVLFVGESGTSKTVTIQNFLSTLDPDTTKCLNMNFSSRTSSNDVQNNIQANVDKRSGKIYGPPAGKTLVIFIDDMNMPKVDLYGTQQPIALLHFLVGRGCMYDRGKDLDLRILKDLQFVAAMGPPGGGRNKVDPRFVALFNVYNLTPPTNMVLQRIYGSILTSYLRNFDADIQTVGSKLTPILLNLYSNIMDKLPPTPSKFHYIFNLRDLGRVYEGICQATPDTLTSSTQLLRLFSNEVNRIFCDRLIHEDDIQFVTQENANLLMDAFPSQAEAACAQPILFGNFKTCMGRLTGESEDLGLYQDLGDYRAVRRIFDEVLETYNLDHKPMQLVLFEMALEHLTRILRIIANPLGNALLIGVGGSGKQSLSKLAAFAAGYDLFEITLTRGYGETEFKDNLKDLYRLLGQKPVVFLFTDAHVVEGGFLEFINNMLTTGMVPALFEPDEKEALSATVRSEVKAAGIVESSENCWNFYVNRCRQNLHIILAMSPSGETLRVRCRNFPGMVSATVMDWFFPWPEDALRKVAEYFLAEETANIPDGHRVEITNHLVHVHLQVVTYAKQFELELRRHYYVTPKNYLDYISNYREQLKENGAKMLTSIQRLDGGLTKLVEASAAVDRMQADLSEKKIVVDAKTVACEELIQVIQEKSTSASAQQEIASVKQAECERVSAQITIEKQQADESLLEALPAIEAAAEALKDLSKADLTELKAFTNPPPLVRDVCYCVTVLKPTGQDLDEDWKGAKQMLGNGNLLHCLQNYAKDSITNKMISKIKTCFKNPNLNLDNMKNISKAGSGLLVWVIAIMKYYEVARNVEPLRQKVRQMEKEQAKQERDLAALNAQLDELDAEVTSLSNQFHEANDELQALKSQADQMEKRLAAASKLLDGLGSEKGRWTDDVGQLKLQGERSIGDCLLAASFLSYAGAFSFDYRSSAIYQDFLHDITTRKIPVTEPFQLEKLLCSDAQIQKWMSEGLPADEHSVQNGILTTKASRFPLCIDPQQQAVNWIKKRESTNNLTVKTLNDPDFMKHLELAIQFGNPFLFESVDEELDPILDPILEKNTFMDGPRRMITLGDKNVEWDANFRLYFTSKLANPHYSPEVMGKTMIINYSVTQSGLANQLLNVVVGHERPDLEEMYRELVEEMSENTQMIVELEDTLLRELSSSTGNILDNEELITTLEETKNKAMEIGGKLEQSSLTQAEISKTREVYTSVAMRGSICYFAMSSLSTILKMYEISLNSFLNVFHTSLAQAKPDVVLDSRLRHMTRSITELMYDYTCTGIFERHKLMFSFQLTCMIMDERKDLVRAELDFFLKGDTSLEGATVDQPQLLSWISTAGWKDLICLSKLDPVFEHLLDDVTEHKTIWKLWYDLESPESTALPLGYGPAEDVVKDVGNTTEPNEEEQKPRQALSRFQQLLLYRCFRQDRVYNAMKRFVSAEMGEKYVQPPVLDYARIYAQSSALAPIVCILSPGADPQSDIQLLGEELGFTGHKFKFLALGQGQGPLAEHMLEAGASRGHWVLLQNCHLLASWLRTLEKTLLNLEKPHVDFRLWLTTEPTEKFPLGILQRSLKVVTEPPDGLKQNMRSLYSKLDDSILTECPNPIFRSLVYVLCFLHAVVLERRKYGKIGWNVPYDFNESDFNISRRLLSLYLTKASVDGHEDVVPWGSLKYLIGDAMYGGRVSDNYDRRVLATYLSEYMGDFLFDDCQRFYFSQSSGFEYIVPDEIVQPSFEALNDGGGENNVHTSSVCQHYVETVEGLPLTNSPAVFGLHANAEIGYYTHMSKSVWSGLLSLQPRSSDVGSGQTRESYIAQVAKDIAAKIPEEVDVPLLRKRFGLSPTPTQVVLLQELDRWNVLTTCMRLSLDELDKALVGEIGMSDALDAVGDALYNGTLPMMWRRLCPSTQKPLGSWMVHFQARLVQYQEWIETGDPGCMWLSGLGIPEAYLTALVQTTCRARSWPLDKSTLYTKVTTYVDVSEIPDPLESGCYVRGLYLEGASWDRQRGCLRRQDPKQLVVELPILQVIPIEASRLKLQNTFRTPVYVTQDRRNAMGVGLVFEADLDSLEHESHWILQGVALCLNIDS